MKNKIFLIGFSIILVSAFIVIAVYLYMQLGYKANKENEINIYTPPENVNLISNVDPFLFTQENVRLSYEGGPVHWGSRTITFKNMNQTNNSKIVTLHVVDESDLKGETPKKEWDQKWEAKFDGSLYIDDILMLKYPLNIGNEWYVTDYSPVINANKKYIAKIKITSVVNSLDNSNVEVKKITTTLTIDDIKTIDGGIYTETRVFESGIGLRQLSLTEPTISEFILSYWLQNVI